MYTVLTLPCIYRNLTWLLDNVYIVKVFTCMILDEKLKNFSDFNGITED